MHCRGSAFLLLLLLCGQGSVPQLDLGCTPVLAEDVGIIPGGTPGVPKSGLDGSLI